MTSRRSFVRTSTAAPTAAALPRWSGWGMNQERIERIGVQLYTLRSEMQRDLEATLARVADIGYKEVEFAGYFGRSPEQIRATLDKVGLTSPSGHMPYEALGEGWARVLDASRTIGHEYTVIAWTPEFKPIGGHIPFDLLLERTDPAAVKLEMDLYWITLAGGDPFAYFAKYPGRFPMVHVKDLKRGAQSPMVDVGAGDINFKAIFAKRREAGIQHYFVEHDEPASPFDSISASLSHAGATTPPIAAAVA